MKYANVTERAGLVFVQTTHQTTAGFGFIQDEFALVSISQLGEMGSAVRSALASSRENVPLPSREVLSKFAARQRALLRAARVRSYKEFLCGSKMVSVRMDEQQVTLVPWKNLGRRDGYVPVKDKDTVVPVSSPDVELGAAIIKSLADAE